MTRRPRLQRFFQIAAAAVALLSARIVSAQLRVVPDDLVSGDSARAAVQVEIDPDANVVWSLERIKPARAADETTGLIESSGKGLAKVAPDSVGTWVVTARVVNADGAETVFIDSFVVRAVPVAAPAAATPSTADSSARKKLAAQAVAEQQDVEDVYGLIAAVPVDLTSDQTLVDERDGQYLQSLDAVAGVFDEFATKPEPADQAARQTFVTETWDAVWVKLREIHPNWAVYQNQYGRTTLGEQAWKHFETKLRKDTLNRILGELHTAGRVEEFRYTKAWREIAAGLRAAKSAQEKWMEELKSANQTYQRYMNDFGGGSGTGGYRGPRNCIQLLLGL